MERTSLARPEGPQQLEFLFGAEGRFLEGFRRIPPDFAAS